MKVFLLLFIASVWFLVDLRLFEISTRVTVLDRWVDALIGLVI